MQISSYCGDTTVLHNTLWVDSVHHAAQLLTDCTTGCPFNTISSRPVASTIELDINSRTFLTLTLMRRELGI